jgi:hypothetical protein
MRAGEIERSAINVACPSSEYLRQKAAEFSGGHGSSDLLNVCVDFEAAVWVNDATCCLGSFKG